MQACRMFQKRSREPFTSVVFTTCHPCLGDPHNNEHVYYSVDALATLH